MDITVALQRVPSKYKDIYKKHWSTIRPSIKKGKLRDMYHFPLFNETDNAILLKADEVMTNYNGKLKINVAFGFVLENRTSGELKFFHPSNNTMLFSTPKLLETPTDYRDFRDEIEKEDAFEYARLQRPSTNWIVSRIVCVRFDVYKLLRS